MKSGRVTLVGSIALISRVVFVPIILLFTCIFAYCCGFYIVPEIYQRTRLAGLEREFRTIPHPPNTTLSERKTDYIPYAANYCAYFVGELREFEGERQEIIDFYTHQNRDEPFSKDLYIVFVEDEGLSKRSISLRMEPEPSWAFGPIVRPDDSGLSGLPPFPEDLQGEFYIVFLAHEGRFYFDYRCH